MMLNREVRLLLLCARIHIDSEQHILIRQTAADNVDWWKLHSLGVEHRVVPLVYGILSRACPDLVPDDVLGQFKHDVQWIVRHNLLVMQQLVRITSLLEANGITSIPYKGPVLASTVYHNVGLRQFGDLDILIHKQDFARAKQLLQAEDYEPSAQIVSGSDNIHVNQHHDYQFVHATMPLVIELQWGVMHVPLVFPSNLADWWKNTEKIRLSGQEITTLLPEHLFLLLCVHGAKHVWSRLQWICDIAEFIRAYPALDWDEVVRLAQHNYAERILFLGLLVAQSLLDAPIPEYIKYRAEQNRIAVTLAEEVRQHYFMLANPAEHNHDATPLFYLRMMDRFNDRLRFCVYCYPSLLKPSRIFRRYQLQPVRHLLGL